MAARAAGTAGAGVAQILDWAAGDLLGRGRLVNLFPDWNGERYPLFAIYPSRKFVAAKVRAFLDFCSGCLAAVEVRRRDSIWAR